MFKYEAKFSAGKHICSDDFAGLIYGSSWAEAKTGLWFIRDAEHVGPWLIKARNGDHESIGRFDEVLKMYFIYDRPVIVSPGPDNKRPRVYGNFHARRQFRASCVVFDPVAFVLVNPLLPWRLRNLRTPHVF